MYVTSVPNRGSPPAMLLRESYREQGKVKTRTLANLSHWPEHKVATPHTRAEGAAAGDRICPRRLRSPAACRTGMSRRCWAAHARLGLPELIDATPSRNRDLVTAMLIAQVIAPGLQAGDRARVAHRDRHQLAGPGPRGGRL